MVTGTHLFDCLARDEQSSAAQPSGRMLPRLAEQMVAASLTSGKMLRELRDRMFPSHPEPAAVAVAQTLRAEFQEWVRDAEAAHARAQQLERQGLSVAGAAELDNLIGATLAMLQVTLEDHFRSLDQIAGGQTFSIEDLRRELQLKRGA
jgi:hypothetical protein